MSIAAEKMGEILALPEEDRAFLVHELIASLEGAVEGNAELEWQKVIDRRSREIEEVSVRCLPVEQVLQAIREKIHARRQSS